MQLQAVCWIASKLGLWKPKRGTKVALLEMLNPYVLAKPGLYKHVAHLSVLLTTVGRNWKEREDINDLSSDHHRQPCLAPTTMREEGEGSPAISHSSSH
jgi:hypothetical protein